MAESAGPDFIGTVTWFDVRTGFCLIRPNDLSKDIFVHRSFIAAVGFRALIVGETVEFFFVKRNSNYSETLRPVAIWKAYILGGRKLGGNKSDGFSPIDPRNSCGETEIRECPDTRLVKSDGDECSGKAEERDWAMLPRDILSIIFKKAGAVVVVASAQFACKQWQQLSKGPDLWRRVDIKLKDALSISAMMTEDRYNVILLEFIAMVAVDRSAGCLEEFSAVGFGTNVLMDYIAERATRLRCLRLISVYDISDEAFVEAVKRFPELEEFWSSSSLFSNVVVESAGQACPKLKTLTLGFPGETDFQSFLGITSSKGINLLCIAEHMHQLRRLAISSGMLSNSSMCTLLESCPHLDYLDVSGCDLEVDENLKKKFASIMEVKLPDFFDCVAFVGDFTYEDFCFERGMDFEEVYGF